MYTSISNSHPLRIFFVHFCAPLDTFRLSSLPVYYIPKDGSLQSYKVCRERKCWQWLDSMYGFVFSLHRNMWCSYQLWTILKHLDSTPMLTLLARLKKHGMVCVCVCVCGVCVCVCMCVCVCVSVCVCVCVCV